MGSTLLGLGHPPPQYPSGLYGEVAQNSCDFCVFKLVLTSPKCPLVPVSGHQLTASGKPYFKLLFLVPSGFWCHQAQKELHLAVGGV